MAALGRWALLRAFLDTHQKHGHRPVYEILVERARAGGLRGATVLAGSAGVWRGLELPEARGWSPGGDREVVVEVLDTADRVEDFAAGLGALLGGALVAMAPVRVVGGSGEEEVETMDGREAGLLLRVYLKEGDRFEGRPTCEALLAAARERGMAAATVLRGVLGFGRGGRVHAAKWEALSTDLPTVVEIVDVEAKVAGFAPVAEALAGESLATLERVWLLRAPGAAGGDR